MRRSWAEITLSRWAGEHPRPEDFVLSRHGNATRSTTNLYYRKDTKLLKEIDDMLQKGMSKDRVYNNIAKKKKQTVSETVTGPKVIDNRGYASKNAYGSNNQQDVCSEAEVLVFSLQTIPMVNSVTFNKDQYVSVNFLPRMCSWKCHSPRGHNILERGTDRFERKTSRISWGQLLGLPQDARKLSSFRRRDNYTETRASLFEEDWARPWQSPVKWLHWYLSRCQDPVLHPTHAGTRRI